VFSKNKITEKIEKKRKEITEKKIKETKAQKKFDEQLLLKFGNLIDLDHLVTWGQSEHLQKKQQKFNMIEKECVKKMRVAEETLERTKRELSDEIKKNTELLNHITTLGEKRNRLQAKLESTNQRIFVIFIPSSLYDGVILNCG
jgi:cilia- and flagella-associated protein 44